ncbi:MAG: hypothetical protein GFH27_549297n295 [Chloroflexi bacterium AL-W]|nr:hypothetical protein [Chloroflexi bacterium AL-N1]NOK68852.1 hypothetical protein [Chloroflexi bacterium AL-N10]NOK76836.1 hypothetical protein [Chloroflexi bacterium AL-N5]NOK82777.1 hypothetical protein [Chloroflexi bacterium AL-W]NOK90693.1 hypothetical protein [Chloroflexi bacterium AL-N15]
MRTRNLMLHIIAFVMLGSLTLASCNNANTVISKQPLTLTEWTNNGSFTPVILWPEPDNSTIWFAPQYTNDDNPYVEFYYSEPFIMEGVEPFMYVLYQGDSTLPVGERFLTDYEAGRSDVTITKDQMTINGERVPLEIRTSTRHRDSGVAVFEVSGTHIAYNWRHMDQDSALETFSEHMVLVGPEDTDIITAFDQVLANLQQ